MFKLTEQEQARVNALRENELLLCRIRRSHTMWQTIPDDKRTESACNAMALLPGPHASVVMPSAEPRIREALDYIEAFRVGVQEQISAERAQQAELRRQERYEARVTRSSHDDEFDYARGFRRDWSDTIVNFVCGIAACVVVYLVYQLLNGGI